MNEYKSLSKNDAIVIEIIWEQGESTNASILKAVGEAPNWSRHSIKTYLKRLLDKGLIAMQKDSPRKIKYYPLVTKEEFWADEASTYLNDHFNGLTHMVAGLVDNEKISDEELDSLEQFIKDLKNKKQGK